MKSKFLQLAAHLFVLSAMSASAAIRYVDVNSSSPALPYSNWATAATTIQDAVDAALAGDQILVTNGVYQAGGRVVFGAMTNRLAVNKPVTVQSVNGAAVTVIRGFQAAGTANGDSAIRCVYLTNGAALVGFTVADGATRSSGDYVREQFGGGVWCESASAVVSDCILTGNSAAYDGGGASFGTLNNCTFTGNSAVISGGGASFSTLNNCTLNGNSATGNSVTGAGASGGGASFGTLNNCILTGNSANYGGDLRLQSNSPCINAGSNAYAPAGPDLDGNPRIAGKTVDIGAYEFQSPQSLISYAWLQKSGLATNGSADNTDTDGDGLTARQEWRTGTNPTNPLSVLRLLSPTPAASGFIVRWQSVNGLNYFLERSTDLGARSPFLPLASDIAGQPDATSFTDTTAVGAGPFFYRVGVQE